ncbi:hypothetical protein HDU91_004114 [Kappamyces sp. JEL0680]|nr:hypothetical protein HDU91_004114 [Kappamyces sp. JEL0680]
MELKRKQLLKDMGEYSVLTGSTSSLADLIVPIASKKGHQLLVKMGLRPDGSIAGKKKIVQYTAAANELGPDGSRVDPIATLHAILRLKKSQLAGYTYGRGYDPLKNAPEFQRSHQQDAKPEPTSAQPTTKKESGFGIGIFEDEDMDTLEMGGPTSYSSVLLDEEEEEQMLKLEKEKEKKKVQERAAASKATTRAGVIPGFVAAPRKAVQLPKVYLAPHPPTGYVPLPSFKNPIYADLKKSMEEAEMAQDRARQASLQASAPEDLAKQSIFSFLTLKNKERLDAFVSRASTIPPKRTSQTAPEKPNAPPPVFTVPTSIAEAALKGFMPFGNDIPKQERYKQFLLDIVTKATSTAALDPAEGKLTDEQAFETREFSKAAMIYRPLSNMIASRFTNETGKDLGPVDDFSAPCRVIRTEYKWKPSKLTCKRFAVAFKDDSDDEDQAVLAESKQALNPETMKSLIEERDRIAQSGEITADISTVAPIATVSHDDLFEFMGQEEDTADDDGAELQVQDKPSMDLFKAIFADSSDEEDAAEVLPPSGNVNPGPATEPDTDMAENAKPLPAPEKPVFSVSRPPEVSTAAEKSPDETQLFFKPRKAGATRKALPVEPQDDEPASFRPMFKSAGSVAASAPKAKGSVAIVGARRKKQKLITRVVDSEDDDPAEDSRGTRPSAKDFM